MTPDFTLIWPLSCLKDGVHLCFVHATDRMDYLIDRVGTALLQSCFLQRQSVCLVISTL